jgi:hypothetical protein
MMKTSLHILFLMILLYCSACGVKSVISPTHVSPLNSPIHLPDTPTPIFTLAKPSLTPTATIFVPPTPPPTFTFEPLPIVTPSNPQFDVWVIPSTYSVSPPFFKVEFSPEVWKLNTNDQPYPMLQHLLLPECHISPSVGRGLPPDYSVEHTFRKIGDNTYELSIVSKAGQWVFSNYCTGNEDVGICFAIGSDDNQQTCIQDAEVVLSTLVIFE